MKISFSKLISLQSMNTCLGFLFSQPYTYIRIILRAIKGCAGVKQSCVHANCDRRQNLSEFIFLLKKLLCLYTVWFCNQGVSWSSSCDELKNFAANIFVKLVSKLRIGIRASNWLVTYWEPCIKMRDCHYKTSPIGYWGKDSTVGWYKVLGFFYL